MGHQVFFPVLFIYLIHSYTLVKSTLKVTLVAHYMYLKRGKTIKKSVLKWFIDKNPPLKIIEATFTDCELVCTLYNTHIHTTFLQLFLLRSLWRTMGCHQLFLPTFLNATLHNDSTESLLHLPPPPPPWYTLLPQRRSRGILRYQTHIKA